MKRSQLVKLIKDTVLEELERGEVLHRAEVILAANNIALTLSHKLEADNNVEDDTGKDVIHRTPAGFMQEDAHSFLQVAFDELKEVFKSYDKGGDFSLTLKAEGSINTQDAKLSLQVYSFALGEAGGYEIKGMNYTPILNELEHRLRFAKINQPKQISA